MHDWARQNFAIGVQQIQKRNVFVRWSVFNLGNPPNTSTRAKQMKGIMIAVSSVLLGTLAYITIGIALASVS
jgi:hypothetical protein